jgi:glycosyltransferase 2 family protein
MTDPVEASRRSLARSILGSAWFKSGVAILIMYLLVHFNRLDWRHLGALRDTWPWLALAFSLMFPPFAIVSYRLMFILRSQGIDASFREAMRWTMIGSLFDLMMPSSNGGDVVKAGLIAAHVGSGWRTRAVMSVAFDRVLGLVGLFLLASVVGLVGWKVVQDVAGKGFLLMASIAGSLGVLAVFRILGSRRLYNNVRINAFLEQRKWGPLIKKWIGTFNELRERPRFLVIALLLSMVNHVFWCAALIFIARAVGNEVPLIEGFVVFPIAIFSNVFGIAGGFGLGTVGFDVLLSLFLGIQNGALIGLLFQTLSAVIKLAGLPFYLSTPQGSMPRRS